MITYGKTSIFKTKAEYLVNPVNCVGVMGAGLAKTFKDKYPEMFKEYKELCDYNKLKPGYTHVTQDHIILFPTKLHYKNPSKIEYIEEGLKSLVDLITSNSIKSIALPKLGCGLGGLNWSEVKPLIESNLGALDIDVIVCE